MLFPALPGLLLIASGYGIAEQTLLPVAQNSRDVMLLPVWAIRQMTFTP